jgi:hypothetical protein
MPSLKSWVVVAAVGTALIIGIRTKNGDPIGLTPSTPKATNIPALSGNAGHALSALSVATDSSMSGYSRAQFGPAWSDVDRNGCSTRNDILARQLTSVKLSTDHCTVLSGLLHDPYTGTTIRFVRGRSTSSAVQIDHVIPLGNAWITGARSWSAAKRKQFANDPANLLAVDAHNNESKADKDAADWLPPYKAEDCPYVKQQVAVKTTYHLTVNAAEKAAMAKTLEGCS